jgi:hypothetical protein
MRNSWGGSCEGVVSGLHTQADAAWQCQERKPLEACTNVGVTDTPHSALPAPPPSQALAATHRRGSTRRCGPRRGGTRKTW